MAASNLNLGKASGGVLNVQPADGTTTTSIVLPASGTVTTNEYVNSNNLGNGSTTFNGFGGTGFKNYIINGGFDIWQRGTVFSSPGNETWTADRWKIGWAGGTVTQVYKGGEVFSSGYNTLAIDGKAGNTVLELRQYIESLNCRKLKAGAKVTVSFDVFTNAGFIAKNLIVNIDRPISIDGFSVMYDGVSSGNIALNPSQVVRKSVTFTIPTNYFSWGVRLMFQLPTGLGAGETIAFGNVQFEDGSVATPFEQRPYGLELALCQRYFEKSYSQNTNIGTITLEGASQSSNLTNWLFSMPITKYKVAKRVVPTVTLYNPYVLNQTGNGIEYNVGSQAVSDRPILTNATLQASNENQFTVQSTNGTLTTDNLLLWHWTANAEL